MAYKRVRRTIPATVWAVKRRGTAGVSIDISHTAIGPKHTTHYVDTLNLDFCDMQRMGGKFHKIMDELQDEWKHTKEVISGEIDV